MAIFSPIAIDPLQVWEEDSTMMFLPMLFSWHLLANLLLQVDTLHSSENSGFF